MGVLAGSDTCRIVGPSGAWHREGVIPADVPPPEILVVCTGNVCRSPMAEALLRHHLDAAGTPDLPVSSAGTLGWNSAGATEHTITALAERGVWLDGHISRRMNKDLISAASLVLAMTNDHADAVRNHHAGAAPRTFVLGQLVRLGQKHGPRRDQGPPPVAGGGRSACVILLAGVHYPAMKSVIRWASPSTPTRPWRCSSMT